MKKKLFLYVFFVLFCGFLMFFKPWNEYKFIISSDVALHKILSKQNLVTEIDYLTYGKCPLDEFKGKLLKCYSYGTYKERNKLLPWNKLVIYRDYIDNKALNNEQLALINKARAKHIDAKLVNFEDGYYFDLQKKNEDKSTYLAFVWDTNFADRGYDYFLRKWMKDLDYYKSFFIESGFNPLKKESFLKTFDSTIANLETAVYSEWTVCNSWWKSIVIKSKEKYLEFFKELGISKVNISNNHSYDCGYPGFKMTKVLLKKHKIDFFGEGRGNETNVLKTKIDGKDFLFIWMNDTSFHTNFKALKNKTKDFEWFKIANFHWWNEYHTTWNKYQEKLAKEFSDYDLIIGHHPHVVQNYTEINNTKTYYSLWNFLFDQPFENTLKWMMVFVEVKEDKTLNSVPVYFKRDSKYYNIESFVN